MTNHLELVYTYKQIKTVLMPGVDVKCFFSKIHAVSSKYL